MNSGIQQEQRLDFKNCIGFQNFLHRNLFQDILSNFDFLTPPSSKSEDFARFRFETSPTKFVWNPWSK